MDAVRTPDDRFADLPGWSYPPSYADVGDGLRMAWHEDGPADGPVVLCLHGEPSWSYLYRTMMPIFAAAGYRAIAPDLIGFGRSDKPSARTDYTYAAHVEWLRTLLFDRLDLTAITLVCQDWGGLLGMRLVGEHPDRFARVVTANTFLPTGDVPPKEAFLRWREFSQTTPDFDIGVVVSMGCAQPVAPEVVAAYSAPFPDDSFKAGAREFPALVPSSPDDPAAAANRAAWAVLETFEKPWLCAFSDGDPITKGADRQLQERIPGTTGQPHTIIEGGGHFLQEDRGDVLAGVVVDWMRGLTAIA